MLNLASIDMRKFGPILVRLSRKAGPWQYAIKGRAEREHEPTPILTRHEAHFTSVSTFLSSRTTMPVQQLNSCERKSLTYYQPIPLIYPPACKDSGNRRTQLKASPQKPLPLRPHYPSAEATNHLAARNHQRTGQDTSTKAAADR